MDFGKMEKKMDLAFLHRLMELLITEDGKMAKEQNKFQKSFILQKKNIRK